LWKKPGRIKSNNSLERQNRTTPKRATKNMNNQSPLASQGSFVEQKNEGRSRVKVAIFLVLFFHGVGLIALLMTQGCKQEKSSEQATEATNTTSQPENFQPTNQVAAPANATPAASNTAPAPAPTPLPPPPPPPAPPTPPVPQAQDYAIAQGDTFSALSKKFGVPIKAIVEANPGVEPTKLKIGQKIHIPAAAAPPSAGTAAPGATGAVPETAEGEQVYTVKSGDTLSSIAKQFGVKVKAIRTANSLTTDRIVVSQKLKIPAKTAAPAPAAGTPAPSDTTSPPPAPASR
jgi:LysM repeat protein